MMGSGRRRILLLSLMLAAAGWSGRPARAEDADRLRPYVWLRSAEFNTVWDVLDGYSLGVGVNLDRHWGVEFAADFYEMYLEDPIIGRVGEQALWNFMPEVRFRYPVLNDRLVPYLIAGVGGVRIQFNDQARGGLGLPVDADGTTWSASVGGGIEYFLADNIAFNLEGKYLWVQPIDVSVDGRPSELDMSAPLVTFGFRVFLSENHPQPMVWARQEKPARLFFGAHFGVGAMTNPNWAPAISLEPEVSRWGPLNQIYGISLGVDWGRHWGVELTVDSTEWGIVLDGVGQVSEYAVVPIIPQFRFRYPIGDGRWVPFLMGGVGAAYGERNDKKPVATGMDIHAKGIYPAASVGGGVEYFFAHNASVSTEFHWNHFWDHEIQIDQGPQHTGDFADWQVQVALRLYLLEF